MRIIKDMTKIDQVMCTRCQSTLEIEQSDLRTGSDGQDIITCAACGKVQTYRGKLETDGYD